MRTAIPTPDQRPQTLVFDLPIPPRGTARNVAASTHWRVRHKATKAYHEDVQIIGSNVMYLAGYLPKAVNEQYRGQITVAGKKQIVNKIRTVYPEPYFEKAKYNITYGVKPNGKDGGYRPKDDGNAVDGAKSAVDALVRIGLIKDDTSEFLKLGDVNIDKSFTGLRLEFTAI
jgi:hypothetical protein